MKKRLIYFTDSYPFSVDYTWKKEEIIEASKLFSEIVIIPFTLKKERQFNFPENVIVEKPTLATRLYAKPKHLKHLFSFKWTPNWVKELFRALPHGKQAIITWYLSSIYAKLMAEEASILALKKSKQHAADTVLFFQWTMNNALLIPLFHQWGYKNIVCRMHGFDLYEFRHQGYLPYKKQVLKLASICTFISTHGKEYTNKLYPFTKNKSTLHYLGAKAFKKNTVHPNQTFHIISLARVIPLKRIQWIAEALKSIDITITWTHIGDGETFDSLKESVNELQQKNTSIRVNLLGRLSPEEIQHYFSQKPIHSLILVSETEGLPLVIMEAFSASIPVIATNVGGIAELVNENNGILLPPTPKIADITTAILKLATEPFELHQQRRKNAFLSYEKSFNLHQNSIQFVQFLNQQCK